MGARTLLRVLVAFGVLAPGAFVDRDEASAQDAPSSAQTVLKQVGFEQRLGAELPLDLEFRDEAGAAVRLADFFRERPVVLTLVYHRCPMLCTLVQNGLLRCVRAVPLDVGRDFQVVVVSIDPRDTPELSAAKRDELVAGYGRTGSASGWHFLTGREESIAALASSVGFRYYFDAESGQYAHASGIVVATPAGRISRYQLGIEYSARDLRLALVEASAGKIGGLVEQLLLLCFHYDPTSGRYGFAIVSLLRLLGLATVVAIGAYVLRHLRRERRRGLVA